MIREGARGGGGARRGSLGLRASLRRDTSSAPVRFAHRVSLALGITFAPTVAAACPSCIVDSKAASSLWLVGLFMLTPFAVFGAVLWTLRRVQRELRE